MRVMSTKALILFTTCVLLQFVLFGLVNKIAGAGTSELTLNQVQLLGSHNSYKQPLHSAAKTLLEEHNPKRAFGLDYSHPPLTWQLDTGIRLLEIDVLQDPKGGRFSRPYAEVVAGKALLSVEQRRELAQPGLKVLHVPDVDFASHCMLFVACLEELKRWSEANPDHLPVFVLINAKEKGTSVPADDLVHVLPFNAKDYGLVDSDIQSVLGGKLITPDTLRGPSKTLREAVLKYGWPTLSESRGKFLFIFDGNSKQRELYRQYHPSLKGRTMFASYPASAPEAAIMIVNQPFRDQGHIQQLVAQGYLVRTRADGGNQDAKTNNLARVKAAFNSGAQLISTDFYPGAPQHSRFDFVVSFEQGRLARCNRRLTEDSCSLPVDIGSNKK